MLKKIWDVIKNIFGNDIKLENNSQKNIIKNNEREDQSKNKVYNSFGNIKKSNININNNIGDNNGK